jgi:hypothetical protein
MNAFLVSLIAKKRMKSQTTFEIYLLRHRFLNVFQKIFQLMVFFSILKHFFHRSLIVLFTVIFEWI